MRLLTKALLYQLAGFVLAAMLASSVVWAVAHSLASKEADERLAARALRLRAWAAKASPVQWEQNRQNLAALLQADILFIHAPHKDVYKDTLMRPLGYDEVEECRMLYTSIVLGGQSYRLRLVEEKAEAEIAGQALLIELLAILLAFGLSTLLVTWVSGYRLWRPFRTTLVSLTETKPEERLILKSDTGILEFDQLNAALGQLSDRQQIDREALRAFARHTAHELRNPLGAARSLADTLMQSHELQQKEAGTLAALNQSLARMERLIRSMLLLARIESASGKGYIAGEADASEHMRRQLASLDSLFEQKGMRVSAHIEAGIFWPLEPALVDVLIGNLLGNALQHGAAGALHVHVSAARLQVSNLLPISGETVGSASTGLGLTIVASVCKQAGWSFSTSTQQGVFQARVDTPTALQK